MMNDDELEQTIVDSLTDEMVCVSTWEEGLVLDGDFTYQEIVAIAELLKKEGRV